MRSSHSTAPFSSRTVRSTGRTGRGTATGPEQGRRLLEQAGCRRGGDGIYSCAGERLSLRFATAAGVERRERTVQLAQAQLRQAGVEVIPVYARPVVFLEILESRDFDLALFALDRRGEHVGTRRRLRLPASQQLHGLLRPSGHP